VHTLSLRARLFSSQITDASAALRGSGGASGGVHQGMQSVNVDDDQGLMAKVAELYYLRDFTQQQIADRLGCSRPTISRLLRRSRAAGVVRIDVIPPKDRLHQFARELERIFQVRDVVVVRTLGTSPAAIRDALGRAAAHYLERVLKGGERVGISWGTTLAALVDHVRSRRLGLAVVPLVGGLGQITPEIHANDLARRLAAAYHGRVQLLHAPAVVARETVRAALLSEPPIRAVLDRARCVEVALVGIGGLGRSSTLIESGYFSPEDVRTLRQRGAVGDICTRPFTAEGLPVDPILEARILAVDLADLRRIPTVIGVAGGVEKASAIAGALRGGLVKVLVTDVAAARAVLHLADSPLDKRA